MPQTYSLTPSDHCLERACQWVDAGEDVIIATVIGTWGSAPQPIGGYMIINASGQYEGSVSGGCVESDIILNATEMLQGDPKPRRLNYSPQQRNSWGVGLPCGGKISVLLEAISSPHMPQGTLPYTILTDILEHIYRRQSCVLIYNLHTYAHFLITAQPQMSQKEREILDQLPKIISEHICDSLKTGQNLLFDKTNKEAWYLQSFLPAIRIIIVGAVHIAQELVKLTHLMGYYPIIIDPRPMLLTSERFPDITAEQLIPEWPDEALSRLHLDGRDAVIVLSHDKKIDDLALATSLDSRAYFIGALGSRRTHQKRIARLLKEGFTHAQCARIHGPVGLDIGSIGPGEIALSIMAQIVSVFRKSSNATSYASKANISS